MRVADVMTRDVATVRPDTPLKDVARELIERGISGMPVVDDEGRVVGVISETDLVMKERAEPRERGGVLAALLHRGDPDEQLKLAASVAGEAMTSPAITIESYWPVTVAAKRMLDSAVDRIPVVRQERLIGIITRADLVRAFARSDEEIAHDVREQLALQEALWPDGGKVKAQVGAGETTLTGNVRRRSEAETLPKLIAKVPGVVTVRSELTWSEDD
jgi:CBS domain-containing protein